MYRVPKINLRNELHSLFSKYGALKNFKPISKYKTEVFTECFHVHYERIQSARIAKRFLDNKSFYGELLHVCYAPEFENVEETRAKLLQREKDVLTRLEPGPSLVEYAMYEAEKTPQKARKRKCPALAITEERLQFESLEKDIWKNVPPEIDPRIQSQDNEKLGFKKHFKIRESTVIPNTVEYGPNIQDYVRSTSTVGQSVTVEDSTKQRAVPQQKVRTTLLPTAVIKQYDHLNKNEQKRIVFRKK